MATSKWSRVAENGSLTTLAAVLYGARDLRIEQRPIPPPSSNEVQISVAATTLCGSDAHYFTHGANGSFKVRHPFVLGHEAAGTVVAVGDDVTTVCVGDRVAVECGLACGTCARCKEGRYNLCPSMEFKSSAKKFPHWDGTLQHRMNHPAALVHRLPPSLSFTKAALAEPLSVVVHAFRRLSPSPGSSVLVYGAGAVGLLACALARSLGCTTVCTVDVSPDRVDLATERRWATDGAVLPHKPRPTTTEEALEASEQTSDWIKRRLKVGDGFDYTVECTGVESCIQSSIHCTRSGGKLALVGMGTPVLTLPLGAAALREVDILGVFRYANCYPSAISLLSRPDGPLSDIEAIVTHRVPLSQANRAFDLLTKGKDEEGKMVVKVLVTGEDDA